MSALLLQVEDLAVQFRQTIGQSWRRETKWVKALAGVSFELRAGESLGIVGESGCGKSTLARALLRLIEPTAGRITWNGIEFTALRGNALRRARREMQIVFQDPPASLDPRMTVSEILERPLQNFSDMGTRVTRRERVVATLEQVGGEPDWLDRYPHEFSGGQCQRIGIARALVLAPKLLVCDEATSALDVSVQAQIINLLISLQRAKHLSYLFISHNLPIVRYLCHRVMVLYLGKVVELAECDEFFVHPAHPYSRALIAAVLPIKPRVSGQNGPLATLQGEVPSAINPPSGCHFRTRCPKAARMCAESEPKLRELRPGHFAACHFAET